LRPFVHGDHDGRVIDLSWQDALDVGAPYAVAMDRNQERVGYAFCGRCRAFSISEAKPTWCSGGPQARENNAAGRFRAEHPPTCKEVLDTRTVREVMES